MTAMDKQTGRDRNRTRAGQAGRQVGKRTREGGIMVQEDSRRRQRQAGAASRVHVACLVLGTQPADKQTLEFVFFLLQLSWSIIMLV